MAKTGDKIKGFFTGEKEEDDAEKIILQTEDGQNVKGYPCTPCIVGTWKDVYESEKIVRNHTDGTDEGDRLCALTQRSFLVCAYGGLIEPISSGQEEKNRRRLMAEGIQKKIEYSDLQFISSFAMEKILDFQIWEEPGEHARGNFRLLLSENETGINSMDAPIQLLGQGNTAGALFSGYPEKVEIKEERGYRIADIQAVSGTILLDQKKSNRVFQKKVQTYMGIASAVTADTDHSACILPGSDMRTGGTLIQYQETDWRFLKRMASQLGLPLVPDTSYYYPRFYLGLPEGEKRELGEIISCDLCFDGRYYAVSGKCLVDREDFICYDVVTRTSLSLGDRVTYEGRELHVSQKKTELAGGEVIFTYRLAGNSYGFAPVTGCIRTNGSTCEGTTIESNGGLVLMAKEGIRLESMTGIAMQGMSDIMALYAGGVSSLCVNGSVDMLGRHE